MEIKQLKFFQAIVKYNSFTEAAEACGISQSGISQQIQSLEKELGVNLFERDNRKFKITEAGEHLYKKSIVLLALGAFQGFFCRLPFPWTATA